MHKTIQARYIQPDGSVSMSRLSHLTGSFTAALVLRIWEQSGHNEIVLGEIFRKLEQLFDSGQEATAMQEIRLLCNVLGYTFSDEIAIATQNPQIRTGFIIAFLSDYDDALLDLTDE